MMIDLKVRLGLQPSEHEILTRGVRSTWRTLTLHHASPADGGEGFRTDRVVIGLEGLSLSIACLDVTLFGGSEAFRLIVEVSESSGADDLRPIVVPLADDAREQGLNVGTQPRMLLVWRDYEYPDTSVASKTGLRVISADALLLIGRRHQVMIQVDPLPTWLSVTHDETSIRRVLDEAYELELFS